MSADDRSRWRRRRWRSCCAHSATTDHALRRFGMRRSSARTSGTGLPFASSRSVGRTSGSSSGGGSMVNATGQVLQFSEHVTQLRNALDGSPPLRDRQHAPRHRAAGALRPDPRAGRRTVRHHRRDATRVALSRMVAAGELAADRRDLLAGRSPAARASSTSGHEPKRDHRSGGAVGGCSRSSPPNDETRRSIRAPRPTGARRAWPSCAKACGPVPTTSTSPGRTS